MKLKYIVSILAVFIIISAAVFVAVLQNQPGSDIIDEDIIPDDEEPTPLGNLSFHDAVNSFAFDIFREVHEVNEGNLFISPYSIFTALAMTYEGARGETAKEMASVLNVKQDNESFHIYMKNLYEVLNTKNEEYNISTANALWVKENLQLLEAYLNVIREYYGGDATEVDYSNPTEAAAIINQWVENHTNGLIKDLITADAISPLTALILTNAIYFKGIWKTQFDPVNTTNRTFETNAETSVEAPTMSLIDTEDVFYYTETDDLQILELPYTGDDISMIILLPKNNDLSTAIDTIDIEMFSEWTGSMVETKMDIYLPKFKVETSYSLGDYLIDLGMNIPFTSDADFSGITGGRDLFISKVLHKAFIDVNEEGTEAAAATAVIMELTTVNGGSPRIVFDCNHPFMYLIQHKQTESILFMGSISDPLA
ncbi:MAG: serpin family protein [Thermoplasmatales archaeon]|nr:MAG: serpin family protein [Thermoplasmatales archaeon]